MLPVLFQLLAVFAQKVGVGNERHADRRWGVRTGLGRSGQRPRDEGEEQGGDFHDLMVCGSASFLQDLTPPADERGMRRMRVCFHCFNGFRHAGISAVAGGALLLCVVTRAENSPTVTNTAALHGLVQRARAGQVEAMLALGDHLRAKGDFANAVGWYRAGAERGDPKAQKALAQCLAAGRSVITNLTEATRQSQFASKATNPPAVASNAPASGFNALLAAIAPAPLKVAAREAVVTPSPAGATAGSTNASAAMMAAPMPELPAWRIRPEEIGDGIHFQRATDLPPLTPSVQEEPAVIRPPEVFR
jgi:hypothetical protein